MQLQFGTPTHTAKHINNLEKIQRRATRLVCNNHRQTSSVSEMLKILTWPSLQNRRQAAPLSTLFEIKEGEVKIKSDHLHPVQARSRRGNDQQYATIGFMAKMTSDCIPSFEELSKIGTHWHSMTSQRHPQTPSADTSVLQSAYWVPLPTTLFFPLHFFMPKPSLDRKHVTNAKHVEPGHYYQEEEEKDATKLCMNKIKAPLTDKASIIVIGNFHFHQIF